MSNNNTWDLLKIKAMEMGKAVSDVACDVVDSSKLKMDQVKTQHQLDEAYEKFGKMCYNNFRSGTEDEEQKKEAMDAIQKLEEHLEAIKAKPEKPDDSDVVEACPFCGGMNRLNASYCSYCGKKMHD